MKVTRVVIVAVGGQGNILAARVLGETAVIAGERVRMSEFHGMAQRGGVVESMILLGDGESVCISDGEADLLVGFEPSETIRALKKCNRNAVVITNTHPVPPFTVALGKAEYPPVPSTMDKISGKVKKLLAFDATSLAVQAGSALALNMVMLGALAGSGVVPLNAMSIRETIREKTRKGLVETNLKAFDLGMGAVAAGA
ncbi:MAG: indolepyruvate oxidoreductase subunit beta [Deltaproteobacteria bacterium]|nr:indolepyruvate oxidoreductase subunit beta [Deltaproteobacteria bacterium]